MKNLNLFFVIILTSILSVSCSSDDNSTEDPENISKFNIDDAQYPITNGYILSSVDGPNNSRHAIFLLNGTIINNEWSGEGCDFSNTLTQGVILNITSSSASQLADGTYEYELFTNEPSLNETNISTNIVVENNCIISSDNIDENQINSGNLIIESSNGINTLTFNFETTEFGTVSGTYVGELELINNPSN